MINAIKALDANILALRCEVKSLAEVVSGMGVHVPIERGEPDLDLILSEWWPRPVLDLPLIEVLRLLGDATMRPFNLADSAFFPDHETEHPMIGEVTQQKALVPAQPDGITFWTVVLDGDGITIFRNMEDETLWHVDIQKVRLTSV